MFDEHLHKDAYGFEQAVQCDQNLVDVLNTPHTPSLVKDFMVMQNNRCAYI